MIFILNKFFLNKNMSKFLIINIMFITLFFIFMATSSFVQFTALGYVVIGAIYLFVNFFIYFCIRFLRALETRKVNN